VRVRRLLHVVGVLSAGALARVSPPVTELPVVEIHEFNRANDVEEFFK
jgi:hypothetical protein